MFVPSPARRTETPIAHALEARGMLERARRFVEILFGEGGVTAADPDDLFDISTGYVTLETNGYENVGRAGLCFNRVDSVDFDDVLQDVEDLLSVSERETLAEYRLFDDEYGYTWVLIDDALFDDLVTDVHMVADTLIQAGYENYLLCAAFAFEQGDTEGYWIYNFKRGQWYPFVPEGEGARDEDTEADLRDLVGTELDLEDDESRQYPMWGIPF